MREQVELIQKEFADFKHIATADFKKTYSLIPLTLILHLTVLSSGLFLLSIPFQQKSL